MRYILIAENKNILDVVKKIYKAHKRELTYELLFFTPKDGKISLGYLYGVLNKQEPSVDGIIYLDEDVAREKTDYLAELKNFLPVYRLDLNDLSEECVLNEMSSLLKDKIALRCPICSGRIIKGKKVYFCENFSEEKGGCKIRIPLTLLGADFFWYDVMILLSGRSVIKKLKKDDKQWRQEIKISNDMNSLMFVKKEIRQSAYCCPKCGSYLNETEKMLFCIEENCGYKMNKVIAGRKLDAESIITLLSGQTTKEISGFKSKNKRDFSAKLRMNEDNRIEFVFPEIKMGIKRVLDIKCPLCGKAISTNGYKYQCACGFNVPCIICKRPVSEEELSEICGNYSTKNICYGFRSSKKAGKTFAARLCLDRENKTVVFNFG